MVNLNLIIYRGISTSSACYSKRNFRKFLLYNKAGTREFKARQAIKPDPDVPIFKRGCRDTGYVVNGQYIEIPEMIPELIVPNLQGFKLKPYVSYRSVDVHQEEFTSKDLFNFVYSNKILNDFDNGKLLENGDPIEPSENELLTPEEAQNKALKTGSDIFTSDKLLNEEFIRKGAVDEC